MNRLLELCLIKKTKIKHKTYPTSDPSFLCPESKTLLIFKVIAAAELMILL